MSTLTPATVGPSRSTGSHGAHRFAELPATSFGWIASMIAFANLALVTVMARMVLGLPTWLDFSLGLVPGAVATALVAVAMIRFGERSWVLWLAAATLLWSFGGWLVFTYMAFL